MSDAEVVPAGAAAPATYIDPTTGRPLGLEDIEESDLVIPRFTIVQKEAVFEDSLTKEKHAELNGVLLGSIKQRVLWPADVDASNKPMCKSYDFHTGVANEKDFPWASAGFKREDYGEVDPQLPCATCKLKEWDSHPSRPIPWCTEQWVFPILTEEGSTALITIQRSGLKAAKSYITGFSGRGKPLFTATTKITLSAQRKGNVDFAVPIFSKTGDTDPEEYPRYGASLISLQEFLRTPRSFADEVNPETAGAAGDAAVTPTASDGDAAGEIPF